jgi:hypothetical protein
MDGRKLGVGLVVLASSLLLLVGTASAHSGSLQQSSSSTTGCTVVSLSKFMAQGEFSESATVGDVIEVSCDPHVYSAGEEVEVTASQLYSRCHTINWYKPNENGEDVIVSNSRSVNLKLDVNGNANVGLIAGPKCMVGESLITVDEVSAPFETYTTNFQVTSTENTPENLEMLPAEQVEDQESSGVVTIAKAEFPGAGESYVRIGAKQLYNRCQSGDKLEIVQQNGNVTEEQPELLGAIKLDNNGNGFVLLMGTDSCLEGNSLIEADLESPGFNTTKANFKVIAPRVRPEGH